MKRLIVMICTVLCCTLLCAAAADEQQIGVVQLKFASNVRTEADAEATVSFRGGADQWYGCFGEADGWYLIRNQNGEMGYVSEKRCVFCSTVAPGAGEGQPLDADVNWQAGDIVVFGSYEQDINEENGPEPIEWIVLEKDEENGELLLLSLYALERQHYHTTNSNATWETSGLRRWLNDTFLQTAFTADEQTAILLAEVTADQNYQFKTTSGGATRDRVFLLSMTEAQRCLTAEQLLCIPTAYAIVHNSYSDPQTSACWWWLRTPGHNRMHTAYVNWRGEISGKGYGVISNKGAVRPAIRVNPELMH